MKKLSVVSFAIIFSLSLFAAKEQPGGTLSLKGIEAAKVFQYASELWMPNGNLVPSFIALRDDAQLDELNFFPTMKKCFALPESYSAKLLRTEKDQGGEEHSRYQLTMNGVAVNDAVFILHTHNGKVVKYNGYLPKNLAVFTTPAVSETGAIQTALNSVNANKYRWQDTQDGSIDFSFYPKGELCIVQGHNEIGTNAAHLAWKLEVFAVKPLSRELIYVDAQTGAIIRRDNRIQNANANSTAVTVYRGNRAIVADSYSGSYRLRETTRGNGISTYNMHKGTSYTAATDFTNTTTTWNNVNTNKDQYAGDAHWGAEMTMDFYQNRCGRNGIDGNGFALKLYVHYDNNYVNAFWDGSEMNFGDGNTTYSPLTSLDITGHEISHGLTEFTANLNYQDESGAMNEAFSDIMGTAVEWYADSTRGNWNIGEDIGAAFRSMSAPKTHQQPNTYGGQYWYTGTQDNGGVHTNSGVENYWYYLLSMGGAGTNDNSNTYTVTGIGRTKATAIAFRMQTVYLVSTSVYSDARFYAIQAATDLYGACSQEVISTANAWYAVGVGAQYSAAVVSNFTYTNTVACSAPYTVNFTNQSANTSNYTWYFGDGQTSNAVNPSHTYNATGVYTVRLISSGGCGTDSVTRPNLVNISSANPCVVVLPASGPADLQTSCTGTIYDNGGAYGPYTNNVNSTVTIAPAGAATVRLTFTRFRLEANYDYLYVYDGASTAGTLIGTYTGYTLPAAITSTQPAITVRFISDPGVVDTGFAINWSCNAATSAPAANFISDVTSTCSGQVQFTDKTIGGVTSWLWNFGDGTFSTQRNPLHTYLTNGTFTVSLTATNSIGSNTKTVTNMITVSKPAAPAVTGGSRCSAGSVTLSATTTNNVNWYDSATSTPVVSTANPFNTPSLSATRTYHAEEVVPQASVYVGPVDSTIGAGAYFNGNSQRALRFKVNKPSKLISVFVYALTTGYRTIQYRDTFGVVIASRSIYIQAGRGRINLNIDLVPSTTTVYELGVADSMNLFRNSAGGAFPYNDSQGMVTIIGNNISNPVQPGYYYYFYNWEVQAPACVSLRAPVTASIGAGLTDTRTSTAVACYGQSTGAASVTPTSGTSPYSYHWGSGQTTSSISNIPAGTYTVSISDNNGCAKTDTIIVTQPSAALSVSSTTTSVLCYGGTTGAIAITATGGTTSYAYNWGSGITTQNRTNLPAGTYTVTVTDAHSCTASRTANVTQPTSALTATATATAVQCYGASTGAIALTPSGGTSAYSYNWGNGITTQNRINVAAGTYTVTITDAHSCTTTVSATVSQPAAALATSATTTSVSCNGGSNGAIALTPSGGTSGYSYNWGGGITTQNRSNLTAGTYTVTVTDAHSCTTTRSATVTQPAAISVQTSSTQASCGQSNGTATANASGGTGTLSYHWASGANTATVSNLSSGNYTVTVTDANLCTTTQGVNVSSPAAFSLSHTVGSVSCNGGNNGTATISPSITPGGYTYAWPGGLTGASQTTLTAGLYVVNVTDGNGCSRVDSITITEPAAITDVLSGTAPLCYGSANGSISLQAQGGTGALNYQWSPNISSLTGLAAGTYDLTITDANNCAKTDAVTLTAPAAITAQNQVTNILCRGAGSTGAATVTATGGTGTLSYQWSNNTAGSSISNVPAGIYIATISDANGCTLTDSIHITEPSAAVQATTSVTQAHTGLADGTATVAAFGGTGALTYQWSTNPTQTTTTATGLAGGTYTVTVTDANGCMTTALAVVGINTAISDVTEIRSLSIYPNPASTSIHITATLATASDGSIEVRDMIGRVVSTHSFAGEKEIHLTLDASPWASAVYSVQIKTATGAVTKQITIQH
ncbi:MAG: M4 family metallopeptidase [Bacteroidetes bacterium]|nr:M4 family metallopeptidase [Bacteroidota bacterium]